MKPIIIITNGTLPVPCVNGGAVESLLQTFIDMNEINNDFKLIIFSIKNNKAISLAKTYKNSKFIFIDTASVLYQIAKTIRYFINRLKRNTVKNQFLFEVMKQKKIIGESGLIIVENNPNFVTHIHKITNKPIGLHLHNDYLNIDNASFSSKIVEKLDFVVTVSKYLEKRVAEISRKKINIECVYNGIYLNRFNFKDLKNSKKIIRDKYFISENELVILFAGRLQETKGIKLLIETFIELPENPRLILIIVGSSSFGGSIKSKFIRQLENLSKSANNKIVFTGYIEYSEIHNIYNVADFAVFPSLGPEAFSLTTIEALASGLPVIISDSGGMPETVNEKCGIVINRGPKMKEQLKEEMVRLINDRGLREDMSIEAKKYVQKFNDTTYYQSLSKVYKSFLQ